MSIEVSEEGGVRYLHFGSAWIQGAMRVARPFALELHYTRDMMFPLLLRTGGGWPRAVLVVGLGAGSVTRFLLRHRPRASQTVVEIEPGVVAAARAHFKLPSESARLRIAVAEASEYLASTDRTFDLILVDGYDAQGRTGRLDSLAFYRSARAHLTERGVLAANLLTRHRGARGSLDRLRAAFDARALALPACASGNVVLLAATGEEIAIQERDLAARARRLRHETGLDLTASTTRLVEARNGEPVLHL